MSKIQFLCTSRAMALRKLAARTRLVQLLQRRSAAAFSRAELSLRWYSLATCLAGFVPSLFRRRLSIPKSRNLTAAIQFELKRIPFHLESNVTQTRNASGTSARKLRPPSKSSAQRHCANVRECGRRADRESDRTGCGDRGGAKLAAA